MKSLSVHACITIDYWHEDIVLGSSKFEIGETESKIIYFQFMQNYGLFMLYRLVQRIRPSCLSVVGVTLNLSGGSCTRDKQGSSATLPGSKATRSTRLDNVLALSSPASGTPSCRGCRPRALEPRGGGLQRVPRRFFLYLFFCHERLLLKLRKAPHVTVYGYLLILHTHTYYLIAAFVPY